MTPHAARPRRSLAGLLLLGLASCGARTATVEGTVSIDDEPITFGTVAVVAADGRTRSAMIRPDGTYKVEAAPVGDVVLTVRTYPPPPQVQRPDQPPAGPAKKGEARFVPIPEKYADARDSPLRYAVTPGTQTYDLKLTRK